MTQRLATPMRTRSSRVRRGFTLVEVLVALAVLSVATSVFIHLFNSSIEVAHKGNDRRVAVALANEQLHAILQRPAQFKWAVPETKDTAFPIIAMAEAPLTNPLEPALAPVEIAVRNRERNIYEQFQWRAFGTVPEGAVGYCEVTVEISWVYAGRQELLALTSSIPTSQIPAAGGTQ